MVNSTFNSNESKPAHALCSYKLNTLDYRMTLLALLESYWRSMV